MSDFMSLVKELVDNSSENLQTTENGAVGYKRSGKHLLDMNFKASSMRKWSETEIEDQFLLALTENPELAITWMFYAGDVRGGMGERRLFKILSKLILTNKELLEKHINLNAFIKYIPHFTRWDNIFYLYGIDKDIDKAIISLLKDQLYNDIIGCSKGESISLLAKWMPSNNTSNKEKVKLANKLAKDLELTPKKYRKMLSKLRKYLNVVEVSMCAHEWNTIEYSAVPSKANLVYNKAFFKNDEERRKAYLESLQKGEAKINASVAFPHDIVHKYLENAYYRYAPIKEDTTLEAMWKALADYTMEGHSVMVVQDGSGSMTRTASDNSSVRCIEIAIALALYFSERCTGAYRNKFITFSENPKYIEYSDYMTLLQRIRLTLANDEVANTNIEAVFRLILDTAIKNRCEQKDLPDTILILSDMEFDECTCTNADLNIRSRRFYHSQITSRNLNVVFFEEMQKLYASFGYKLPKLVFWNICSRTCTIPLRENDAGVALVSGFSPAIIKMVLSDKLDPYAALVEQLNDERYQVVKEEILK